MFIKWLQRNLQLTFIPPFQCFEVLRMLHFYRVIVVSLVLFSFSLEQLSPS